MPTWKEYVGGCIIFMTATLAVSHRPCTAYNGASTVMQWMKCCHDFVDIESRALLKPIHFALAMEGKLSKRARPEKEED